jgi:hypothetical protein
VITAILQSHPQTPCPAIRAFSARLHRSAADRLELQYRIDGDIAELLVPALIHDETDRTRQDGLWKHTCCEVFLKRAGLQPDSLTTGRASGYYEFNFSPSGAWAAYAFDSYRTGMLALEVAKPPAIAVSQTAARLTIDVAITLPQDVIAAAGETASVTAVIEDRAGRISYWAVAHAPLKPDFHHDNGFVLRLPIQPDGTH